MAFKALEDRLPNDKLELYLELDEKLKEPTKTTLKYLLDIASTAEKTKLEKDYMVIGGYAVLAHLVSQYGEGIIPTWRGSDDIDMAGSIKMLNTIRSFYNVKGDRQSPNVPNKRTLKIISNNEKECKIDYIGDNRDFDTETVNIFGIPLKVSTPLSLIKNKLEPSKNEKVHKVDIIRLLGVLEYKNIQVNAIASSLDKGEMRQLYNITKTYRQPKDERMDILPSKRFISDLKTYINKHLM